MRIPPSRVRRSPFGKTGKRGAILSPHRFCVPCWSRLGVVRKNAPAIFGVSEHTLKTYGFTVTDIRERVKRAHKAKAAMRRAEGVSVERVMREQADAFRRETSWVSRIDSAWERHHELLRFKANKAAASQYAKHKKNPIKRLIWACRVRLWKVARKGKAGRRTVDLFGCTPEQLRQWIERQFKPGMTWQNYGEWEIDHVRPCASFDLSDPKQVSECFHFTNTQPMWMTENRSKHSWWGGSHHRSKRQPVSVKAA